MSKPKRCKKHEWSTEVVKDEDYITTTTTCMVCGKERRHDVEKIEHPTCVVCGQQHPRTNPMWEGCIVMLVKRMNELFGERLKKTEDT